MVNYRLLSRIGSGYVGIQRKRVAFGLQKDAMITTELVRQGLYVEEKVKKKKEEQIGQGKTYIPIFENEFWKKKLADVQQPLNKAKEELNGPEDPEKKKAWKQPTPERARRLEGTIGHYESELTELNKIIEGYEKEIAEKTAAIEATAEYKLMDEEYKGFLALEKNLLHKGVAFLKDTFLWKWCLDTDGLKEVAALSFAAFCNPQREIKDPLTGNWRGVRLAEVKSYLGLTPDSKMLRNQTDRKNYAKGVKGRLVGIIIPNIIRAKDPYYKPFYDMKKAYYLERPDMVYAYREKEGLRGRCDNMSKRFLIGILVSHAFELMLMDEDAANAPGAKQRLAELRITDTRRRGGPPAMIATVPGEQPQVGVQPDIGASWRDKFAFNHRVPIPIKPKDITEWRKIQEDFARFHVNMLEMLKKLWIEDEERGDVLHKRYYRFLQFGKID